MTTRRAASDAGFTLAELLLSVVILGIISFPLGNLMIEYLDRTTQTTTRLYESHDAQLTAAYFAQDAASVGLRDSAGALSPSIGTSGSPAGYTCAAPVGSTRKFTFAWDDYDSTGTHYVDQASYVTATVSGQNRLIRVFCRQRSTVTGTIAATSTATLAHNISSSAPPSLACSTTCTGTPPATMTLTLTILSPLDTSTPYQVLLTGERRQT